MQFTRSGKIVQTDDLIQNHNQIEQQTIEFQKIQSYQNLIKSKFQKTNDQIQIPKDPILVKKKRKEERSEAKWTVHGSTGQTKESMTSRFELKTNYQFRRSDQNQMM